ncbi:MAG: hypothetical protein AB8B91_18390 [Rubripirellula sp.]
MLWKEDPRRGRLVVACCHHARALGIRVSMPIAQAGEMAQQSDHAPIIDRHDPALDREALEQVANQFQQQISPLVCIESLDRKPWADYPRHQCEAIFCDVAGAAHLFTDEAGVIAEVSRLLRNRGMVGRVAIADSMGAAWALSHYLDCLVPADKIDQGYIAGHHDTEEAIQSLPIEALRIPPETVHTLGRLGVESIGQLLQLPRSGLATRLGLTLVKRIGQVLGEADEPMEVFRAPAEHWTTLALEYPTSDQAILADRIERLIEKVRAGLATRKRGALRVTCCLDLSDHPPLTLEIGLFAPTIDADHLSGLMINQLESKKLSACVDRITISVTQTGPLRTAQQSLFDADIGINSVRANSMSGSEISRLVDSLSSRLGRDCVSSIKLEDDPLPEKAFSVQPLAGNRISSFKTCPSTSARSASFRSQSIPKSSQLSVGSAIPFSSPSSQQSAVDKQVIAFDPHQPSPDDAMRRPLSLLPEPIPLAVARENGSFCDFLSSPQLPSRIRLGGVTHQIVMSWGPERIETGWWKGPCIRRDYYRIETDSGRWWWIFRELGSKSQVDQRPSCCWWLHGRF